MNLGTMSIQVSRRIMTPHVTLTSTFQLSWFSAELTWMSWATIASRSCSTCVMASRPW